MTARRCQLSAEMYHRGENGQQQPGTDVVNRRARDSGGPQVRSKQVALFQDSGKYRERGDAHCRSHEQGEWRKCNLCSGKLRIEDRGQSDAQGKRQNDADVADKHYRSALFHYAVEIDLKSDDEHEEQKPKLT